jgi:hypothetical protein
MSDKMDEVVAVLNKMIDAVGPVKFDEFNVLLREREPGRLSEIENSDDRIGIRPLRDEDDPENPEDGFAISTASIIATLTMVLTGKRLAFVLNEDGYVVGFRWYRDDEENEG